MNTDLVKYYKDRAKEYERIYSKPERQEELLSASDILQHLFKDKDVLEIACGTGYWTKSIADAANFILATDINEEVLTIAKQKEYPKANVLFERMDIFDPHLTRTYQTIFAGFIWSHIKKQDLGAFIKAILSMITNNGTLVVMDNNYVEGSSHPVTKTDEFGNTFQTRKLDDGTSHLVLKNFPTKTYFMEVMKEFSAKTKFIDLKYFWIAVVTIKK